MFFRKEISDIKLLNVGLKMAMEFGENWLQPINRRLQKKFKFVPNEKISEISEECHLALDHGNGFLYEYLKNLYQKNIYMKEKDINTIWTIEMLAKHQWISSSNLKRLYSQAMYYSQKEGVDAYII